MQTAFNRTETIVRAFKKAWNAADASKIPPEDRKQLAIYLLATSQSRQDLHAFDFAEFAAFLGGVIDGDFLEQSVHHKEGLSKFDSPDWTKVALPQGITAEVLSASFDAVFPSIVWQNFGDQGGLSWGRVLFHISQGNGQYTVDCTNTPSLTRPEIRAVARLPHPCPDHIARRGYLVASEFASVKK